MNNNGLAKVIIDPRARIAYASYYIQGIIELFGVKNVHFKMSPFKMLIHKYDEDAFDQFFAFIVMKNGEVRKIVIDYKDNYPINSEAHKWCDVYGKVNLNENETDFTSFPKIKPIGPGFGIKIWNYPVTIFKAVINIMKCFRYLDVKLYPFLYGYYWQIKRLPIQEFRYIPSDGKKIFFVSTLWKNDNCIKSTNVLRAAFVETCKKININFEGGLYTKPSSVEYIKYKDLVYSKFVSFSSYLQKTQKSAVVFNTPSVFNCHGWKLGEYFALGKAIISTPLSNMMPAEVEHGRNIHFIKNTSELEDSINKILCDNDYRASLEKGALEYFNEFLAPVKVIERLTENS